MPETNENDVTSVNLLKKLPGCEDANFEDVEKWMKNDETHDLTEEEIVQIVTNHKTSEENDSDDEAAKKIPRTVSYEVIQTTRSTSANRRRRLTPQSFVSNGGEIYLLLQQKFLEPKNKKSFHTFLPKNKF